jgi:putative endonuclease
MVKHTEIGTKGEQLAAIFLKNKGYLILEVNWRFEKKEIDIIASKEQTLVFVEVKTRSNFNFGFPEEAVTETKKSFLKIAAQAYYEQNNLSQQIRFDIISVLLQQNKAAEILHVVDAFY